MLMLTTLETLRWLFLDTWQGIINLKTIGIRLDYLKPYKCEQIIIISSSSSSSSTTTTTTITITIATTIKIWNLKIIIITWNRIISLQIIGVELEYKNQTTVCTLFLFG